MYLIFLDQKYILQSRFNEDNDTNTYEGNSRLLMF